MDITEIRSTLAEMVLALKARGLGNPEVKIAVLGSGYGQIQVYPYGTLNEMRSFDISDNGESKAWAFIHSVTGPEAYLPDFTGPLVLAADAERERG